MGKENSAGTPDAGQKIVIEVVGSLRVVNFIELLTTIDVIQLDKWPVTYQYLEGLTEI
ncbi:hypothetical protein [Pseudomonas sp. PDM27]|uniref:hypothetical protein n=1 Tax=Pseudomonas sp. PDM27 TaxID=2854769 RepID=UPI001C4396F8|nr:hypothetical protein [Pseudomonas sp. PDM27]MBV7569643.1 hypothetical protein [Pseudomonas sp. PDM27]